jgi:hypothetical protein
MKRSCAVFMLIGCAWVLWQSVSKQSGMAFNEAVLAFETREECMREFDNQYRDWTKKKGHRKTQDARLYNADNFLFSYTCLPDTVDPRGR